MDAAANAPTLRPMNDWNAWLMRWADAGLIDAAAAARIRAYETAHAGSGRLRWPVMVALAFGALMLGGGVLLFVAAHWDALSPAARFAHRPDHGRWLSRRRCARRRARSRAVERRCTRSAPWRSAAASPRRADLQSRRALAVGHPRCGRSVRPPAWAVLRQTPQVVLLAILVPAWLLGEWSVAVRYRFDWMTTGVAAAGACHDGPDLFHARQGRRVVPAGSEHCCGLAA